jgi:hypothetical protein
MIKALCLLEFVPYYYYNKVKCPKKRQNCQGKEYLYPFFTKIDNDVTCVICEMNKEWNKLLMMQKVIIYIKRGYRYVFEFLSRKMDL